MTFVDELFRTQPAAQRPLEQYGQLGRFGDTLLAHISPQEAQTLQNMGGSGSRNPHTGLLEFFTGGGPGTGPSGGGPGGAASGGPAGGGAGGFGGRGPERGDPMGGIGPDVGGFGMGGIGSGGGAEGGPAGDEGRGEAGGAVGSDPGGQGPGGRGGAADPQAPPGTPGAPIGIADPTATTAPDIGFAEGLLDVLGFAAPALSTVAPGLAAALSAVTGPIGIAAAANRAAESLGEAATSIGLAGDPGTVGQGPADPGAPTGSDPAAFGGTGGAAGGPLGGGGQDPKDPPPEPETIPLLDEPASLRLSSQMTPLQKRAAIATFGTGAESGRFRSPEVQSFYKNFLLRELLDNPESAPLPVENQFLNQVLGLDVNEATPRDSLLSLLGNPAPPPEPNLGLRGRKFSENLFPGASRLA